MKITIHINGIEHTIKSKIVCKKEWEKSLHKREKWNNNEVTIFIPVFLKKKKRILHFLERVTYALTNRMKDLGEDPIKTSLHLNCVMHEYLSTKK